MTLSPEIWALIGVGLGAGLTWLFGEISTARARRYEDRKPLGRALSLLLEAHQALFFYEACRRMGARSDSAVAKKICEQMKLVFPRATMSSDELEKAYDSAVEEVAAVAPTLAFELRHKFKVRTLFNKIHSPEATAGSPESDLAHAVGCILAPRALRSFEKVLLELGQRFSRSEYRSLESHFAELARRLDNLPSFPSPEGKASDS
jgi:hypothetical protein